MAKTTKSKAKSSPNVTAYQIKKAIMGWFIKEGRKPIDLLTFLNSKGWSEEHFYNHFDSLDDAIRMVWADFIAETIAVLDKDPSYPSYSSREKLLAFYYAHLDILKKHRSFVLLHYAQIDLPTLNPPFLEEYGKAFRHYVDELLMDGLNSGEIAHRPLVSDRYGYCFWYELLFLIRYWIKDKSPHYEKTDEAIEKAVNLSFEVIKPDPMSTVLDKAKDLFQKYKR